jgi:hypothetical protein
MTYESRMISYSNESCREEDHGQIGDLLHLFRNECKRYRIVHEHIEMTYGCKKIPVSAY